MCQKKQVIYQVSGPTPDNFAEWDRCAATWKRKFPGANNGDTREGEKHKCYIPIYLMRVKAPKTRNAQGHITAT